MDALTIGGYTRDTLYKATTRIDKDLFELYRVLFFDLTGITAMHSWINHFLFEPERYAGSPLSLRARLLAYYSSVQDGMDAASMQPLSRDAQDCMKRLMENERLKKSSSTSSRYPSWNLKSTRKSWSLPLRLRPTGPLWRR